MFELMVESSFSGAHQLLKSNSPCENLHGHNWKVQLTIKGERQEREIGWVIDFKVIKNQLEQELDKYDHKNLNEILEDSPTAENIARTIYRNLKKTLPVSKVVVWETERASVTYYE